MQETILNIVATANKYLSDYVLIIMLVVAGLFFSFNRKFKLPILDEVCFSHLKQSLYRFVALRKDLVKCLAELKFSARKAQTV